ncbi:MAG: FKBP-type peptidyl-prolyl cis-trans isomerase [Saprospiraceae bacterium]|nr:FKBP-type peptidyl-prolyl cis-trans isomerase [Saprospiraceae bacterium]
MKILQSITLVGLLALLISCSNQESHGDQELTRRGYRLERHVSTNGPKPAPGEYAYFQIVMRHQDSIFNTSYGSDQIPRIRIPAEEEYTEETPVIVDALAMMSAGDSATLYFPLDSLDQVPPAFADIDVIEYDLKFLEIKTDEEFKAEMQEILDQRAAEMDAVRARKPEIVATAEKALADYKAGRIQNLQKTESGLEYVIHEEGTGAMPKNGDMVAVQYYGTFMDGKVFDNSYDQGEPYRFPLGQGRAIKGWDEGIGYLKQGTRASLFIPPSLGYGESGYMDIPGNTQLYFLVELVEVN